MLSDLGLASLPTDDGVTGEWPVYAEIETSNPDNIITTFTTVGRKWGRNQLTGYSLQQHGVMFRVRSSTPEEGAAKVYDISKALEEIGNFDKLGHISLTIFDGTKYKITQANITPIRALGPEGKFQQVAATNRMIYTLNATLVIHLMS